jgi:hypothetical protein
MLTVPAAVVRIMVQTLSVLYLASLSFSVIAETVTFEYQGTDGAGGIVTGTFGFDISAPDTNDNNFAGTYLTGFINGLIAGGNADGFSFDLSISGEQMDGNLLTRVSSNEFFSSLSLNEIQGPGEFMHLDLESTSQVFADDSLPTQLDLADWSRKLLDIRSLLPTAELFELTMIQKVIPAGTFQDVPSGYWAIDFIRILATSGVTGGCGSGNYCPEDPVTRAQMAVFLERGMRGSDFVPPAPAGNVFLDVTAEDFAAAFIEQLFSDGITGGCGGNNYCPGDPVTRAQMAVFLLRARYGASYAPPPANGVFDDVSLSYWAAAWIEQLATEGITGGCGTGNYCPEDPVTRAQMAVFLVRTFGL